MSDEAWVSKPTCCAAAQLERDERFGTVFGPTSERVVRCLRCAALWVEEWTTRFGWESEDQDFYRYLRTTDDDAAARLGWAGAPPPGR